MFSIIIPTCNRAAILDQCLQSVFRLAGIEDCEVLVVDDGSVDSTQQVLEKFRHCNAGRVTILRQDNRGAGVARNAGVRLARGDYLLFLDDDVLPDRSLIHSHRDFIARGFDISQGVLYWHPDIQGSRVLRFMDSRKMQFDFSTTGESTEINFLQVYTANLAMKKTDFLKQGGFDDLFSAKRYGFEDTAFAYTLQKAGLRLGLNRQAWAYHNHPMTEDSLAQREYKVGYCAGVLEARHPEIARALRLRRITTLRHAQALLLRCLLAGTWLEYLAGYTLFLRLRCREAFIRGYGDYRQEHEGQH